MTTDHDDQLHVEAKRNRSLDRELAQRLGRPAPAGEDASGRYLHELVRAPRVAEHGAGITAAAASEPTTG
jgi:hypothetical protein